MTQLARPWTRTDLAAASLAASIAVGFGVTPDGYAQSVPYVATQFTQPYVPLAGATAVLQPNLSFGDQAVSIPIGFTFEYYGESYDWVEVAENGVLLLKQSCAAGCSFDEYCDVNFVCARGWVGNGDWEGLPSSNTPNSVIAAYWDDFILDSTNPASVVQYRVIGAAPTRELVVEWRNMRHQSFFTRPTARTSFQIRLSESDGNIRLHYGASTAGMDNNEWSGRVGIEDRFGFEGITPLSCAENQGFCDWNDLTALSNQVIEIGVPNIAELTGSLDPTLGGQPGSTIDVGAFIRNVGLQPSPAGFDVAFYISDDATVTADDTLIATVAVPALEADSGVTITATAAVPMLVAGYYTFGAIVDSGGVVTEATEQNNTILSPEPFLIGADLAAEFLGYPAPLPPGAASEVIFSVTNRSSAVDQMSWRVYLSYDGVLDGSDPVISAGSASFPGSQVTEVVAPVTIPETTPIGYYTLIAVVDPDGALDEIDEFNNEAYGFVVIGPDLYPSFIDAPSSSGPGAALSFTLYIGNSGSEVPGVEYAVYLSTDQRLDAADLTLATGSVEVLGAQDTPVELSTTIPDTTPPGVYYLIAIVDGGSLIEELEETNNTSTFQTIHLVGPDLFCESLAGAPLAFRGQPYVLDAVVANLGGQPVDGFYVSFHLSVNQLVTTSDPLLVELGPLSIQPNERLILSPEVVIDPATTPGTYWLGAIADSTSLVVEEREQNNIRRSPGQVVVRDTAPDYVITEIRTPDVAGAGETVPLQRTLENQGNATGTAEYDVFLVSLSGATRYALISQGSVSLAIGQIQPAVDVAAIPAYVAPGEYRVEYVLDPELVTEEIDEDNNVARSEGTIAVENAQLTILTTSMPVATVGVPYEVALASLGGTGPVSWSLVQGELPGGLSLDRNSGRISGTPEAEAFATFIVRAADGALQDERELSILVAEPSVELEIVTRSLPPVWVGINYEYPLTALGGVPPYSWTVRPDLPFGLTLTSSGTIAGVTSTVTPSAVYTFRVEDTTGASIESPMALRALARDTALRFRPQTLPSGVVGTAYAVEIEAENGVPPYQLAIVEGEPPPGLAIEDNRLAGVPTDAGQFIFLLRVSDGRGDFDVEYFVVDVEPSEGVQFVTRGLPPGKIGAEYLDEGARPVFVKAISTGSSSPITYLLSSGALPAGITLEGAGRLSGTPTEAGVFSFTVTARDGLNQSDVRAFGIAVADVDKITPTDGGGGCGCGTTHGARGGDGVGPWALLGLGLAAVGLRLRRRGVTSGLAVWVVLGASAEANAQRGDAGVPPGPGGGPSTVQYFNSELSDPYVERTSGTPIAFFSNDDDEQIIALPFTFRFWENDYTEVHVSTNGYVAFDDSAYSYSNEASPSPNPPNNSIFAYWDDLWTTDVTVSFEGTSPNQVAVFQWRNSRHLGDSGHSFNMQIRLYEGPAARFEIHYGPNTNAANVFAFSASVGFEDWTGTSGFTLRSCSPSCTGLDLAALENTVLLSLQDAGTDVNAASVYLTSTEDPLRVYQGIPTDIVSELASYHGEPIGPFTYSLYLLAPNERTPSQPAFFTSSPVTLSPYQTLIATDAVSIPLTTPPGRYRVALWVDPENSLSEPNEDNNFVIGGQELLVGERRPDLVVPEVTSAGGSAAPGDTLDVAVTLQNAGNLEASTAWKVVLSPNAAPSPSDPVIYTSPADTTLGEGESQTLEISAQLPASLRSGRYYIGVLADPANAIAELDEVNNIGRSASVIDVASGTIEIATAALPSAYVGVAYSVHLTANGGDGAFTWALTGGELPDGLTFLEATGELRGTPSAEGSASLTFQVTSNGLNASKTLALEIHPISGPLTIVTRALLPGVVGVPYPPATGNQGPENQQRIIAVGGAGPATFSAMSQLPAGLTLDPDGYLHGVPDSQGDFELVIVASDGASSAMRTLRLSLVEPGRLSLLVDTLPDATLAQAYSYRFHAAGQAPRSQLTFALIETSGALPAGLSLSEAGELSGSPTHAGVFDFSIQVTEVGAGGATDSANFRLVVSAGAPLGITPAALPDAIVGKPYEVTIEARAGQGPYTWEVQVNGELPRGLRWDTVVESGEEKLRISGTAEEVPSAGGSDTGGLVALLILVDDDEGRHGEQPMSLRVVEAPEMLPVAESTGGCGCTAGRGGGSEGAPAWALTLSALALSFTIRRRLARARKI